MDDTNDKAATFEQALVRLEQIVRELENGQVGLEESLARYEEGIGLLKGCYGQLQAAEKRILELVGVDEQGQPLTKPFEHKASVEKKKKKNEDAE